MFLSLYIRDFPVQALLRAEPDLRSHAVVVLESKAPLQKVFAANEKARRAGVGAGMTKSQVEACTDLVLRNRSLLQEAATHAALLDCAQSFSPRVEDLRCDAVLLDADGLEPLFGPLSKIAHDVARRASELGVDANVAVASNPDAAALAARGFDGVTVIAQGGEAKQLGSLPVDVLFADDLWEQDAEQILDTLERWGVRTLRALAGLPNVSICERLGETGVRLQQLARGAASRTLVPIEAPLIFEEAIELENPLILLEPLAFLLGRLLDQLCARLNARALATQELQLQLELDPGYPRHANDNHTKRVFQRTLRLPVPLLDPKVFLKLLQLDLNAHPPGAPIIKIRLAAQPVRPRAIQSGLFLPPSPEPEKLELTLARIAGIVGEEKAGSLELLDTHRPEGFRMKHFTPAAPETNKPSRNSEKVSAVTALRVFRPPVRVLVTVRDGKPARIACPQRHEVQGEILWIAGPWRSSGDWWEHEGWARDEWDIALQTAAGIGLYRLVRDLMSGGWFVEGMYD
jgi:protein ImuB